MLWIRDVGSSIVSSLHYDPCDCRLFTDVGYRPGAISEACELVFFFFQAEDGIRDLTVTGVQTCALPICSSWRSPVSENTPQTLALRQASAKISVSSPGMALAVSYISLASYMMPCVEYSGDRKSVV